MTIQLLRNIFILFVVSICFTACSPFYYAPNAHNVPMFEEKGQIRATGGISGGRDFEGYEAQAAYSVLNHVAVMANGSYTHTGIKKNNRHGNSKFLEVGMGYFTDLAKGDNNAIKFETFGGMGRGKTLNIFGLGNYSEIVYNRYFLQTGVGWKFDLDGIYFKLITSTRAVWMDFKRAEVSDISSFSGQEIRFVRENNNPSWLEPAFTLQFGLQNVQLQQQVVFTSGQNPDGRHKETLTFNTMVMVLF